MSLIGAAIAGGLQGGGEAAKASLGSMQDAVQKEELTRLANELDEQKQMRIQANNQQFLSKEAGVDRAFKAGESQLARVHDTGLLSTKLAHESVQGDKERASKKEISAASNAAHIQSTRISAGAHLEAARLQLSKPTPTMDASGNMFMLSSAQNKKGEWVSSVTPLTDPTSGKQIVARTDLSARAQLELKGLQDLKLEKVKAIDKALSDPATTPEIIKKLQDQADDIQIRWNATAGGGVPLWQSTQYDPQEIVSKALGVLSKNPSGVQKMLDEGTSRFGSAWKEKVEEGIKKAAPSWQPYKPGESGKPPAPPKKDPLAAAIESKLPVKDGLLGRTMSDYSTQQFPRFDDIVNRK
jgi:hypothetical protein